MTHLWHLQIVCIRMRMLKRTSKISSRISVLQSQPLAMLQVTRLILPHFLTQVQPKSIFPTLSELLDAFYASKAQRDRVREQGSVLIQVVKNN